jgi:hypothetical protein
MGLGVFLFYLLFPRCSVFSKPLYNRYSDGQAV